MFSINELRNGLYILIDQKGDAFPKTFPSYNLIVHFVEWLEMTQNDGKYETIENSYNTWRNIYFKDGLVCESTFNKEENVIKLLKTFFDGLTEEEKEWAQMGACGFVDWLVQNGYTITKT